MTADFHGRRRVESVRRNRVAGDLFAGTAPVAAVHLRGMWFRLRRVAAHAVSRRMNTEMSDLAMRIRKLQDIDDNDFQRRSRGR